MPREVHASTAPHAWPDERMAWLTPGTTLSMTARVASGVLSRGPTPVPPRVSTRSTPPTTPVSMALRISDFFDFTRTTPSTW